MSSSNAACPQSLPLSGHAQWAAALSLVVLLVCTRGQHFATIQTLPSASWAVFFLAGALLRPRWVPAALFAISSLLDLSSLRSGSVSDWCLSPAYWALALAYASLWLGGRWYANRWHDGRWRSVPRLALCLVASASGAYLLSKGGFYFFSGRYPEADLAGFLARVPRYYPAALGTLAGYAAAGVALASLWQKRVVGQPQRVSA